MDKCVNTKVPQFSRSLANSESTARRYLDILAGAHKVRILPTKYKNLVLGERQI